MKIKMNKRVLKVAVISALTVAFAVPAFANPFSDVPAKHWSYAAVNQLAQAGVIDGYGDGTFKGDKTMTRYEMAQIVAKAMTKTLTAAQQANVDQLSKEYAAELNTLGVKVDGIQTQIDNMPVISGDLRARYGDAGTGTVNNNGVNVLGGSATDVRGRVGIDAKVNDNLGFHARVSGTYDPSASDTHDNVDGKLDTANVTFKALGLDNTIGRQDLKVGSGILFDDALNGIATKSGNFKAYAGRTSGTTTIMGANTPATQLDAEDLYGAQYSTGILNANVTADYLKRGDNKAYAINGALPLGKSVTALGEYINSDAANGSNGTATAFGLKLNSLGLSATHRDADAGVYNAYSNVTSGDVIALPTDVAIKGMEYQFDKNLAKNVDMNVKYQDFDNMDARTSAAVNVKF